MSLEEKIAKILISNNLKLSIAESCTGGLLSSKMTDVSGSSAYTTLNLITYSDKVKRDFLNVSQDSLLKYSAVSKNVAEEMVKGLLNLSGSDIALVTTGVAGPGKDEALNPVGLVYIGFAYKKGIIKVLEYRETEDLSRVIMKERFVQKALSYLYQELSALF